MKWAVIIGKKEDTMRSKGYSNAVAVNAESFYRCPQPVLQDNTQYLFKAADLANTGIAPNNVVWQNTNVSRNLREARNGHRSINLWFTGLSGSGKTTLGNAVEDRLYQMGYRTFLLDGDNVRHGLCSDLNFSLEDRSENIRRIAETVNLFLESGVIVLTTFISPLEADRQRVRSIIPEGDFVEVYCRCPLEVCEERDVKGLYKLARAGKIKNYTGISSPYEEPNDAELVMDTGSDTLEECVKSILYHLKKLNVITLREVLDYTKH